MPPLIFICWFRTHLVHRPPTTLRLKREPSPGLSFRYRNQQHVPNLPRSLHQELESRRNGPPFIPQMFVPVFRGYVASILGDFSLRIKLTGQYQCGPGNARIFDRNNLLKAKIPNESRAMNLWI